MLPLGTEAPGFALPDAASGRVVQLADFAGQPALLIAFICNHCPFVVHIREPLAALIKEYQARGLAAVAVCSNDAEKYPEDSPSQMAVVANKLGFTFPYLHDETQTVARDYHAACTPDFYVFDASHRLVYRGRFDDSRPGRPRLRDRRGFARRPRSHPRRSHRSRNRAKGQRRLQYQMEAWQRAAVVWGVRRQKSGARNQ